MERLVELSLRYFPEDIMSNFYVLCHTNNILMISNLAVWLVSETDIYSLPLLKKTQRTNSSLYNYSLIKIRVGQ